jgi:titin
VGGSGCTSSGWQSGTSYTATGLSPSTSYTYHVTAKDQAGNLTAPSATASATTAAPPPPPLAPTGLGVTSASENEITLAWTDNATTETGYRLERSDSGLDNFAIIANLAVNATSFTDTGLEADTTYDYRVAAVGSFSDSGYATASATTDAPPPYTNVFAFSETAVAGTVSGTFNSTHDDDGSSQSIMERESGGKPANRHTYLEHRWNFNISAGETVTVYANAWSGGSTDGDTFDFEYSLNNGGFQPLFNVSSGDDTNFQFAVIPGSPSGAISIRVIDTDQGSGNREKNTVFVDHLYIQVGTPSSDPPIGDPSGLTATAVAFNQVDLTWTDGTENESGFTVDRSPDNSNWNQVADLPAGSTSFNDTGLIAETRYFYRVRAYNSNGFSAYTSADATTPEEPAVALVLSASGYKSKGMHGVNLSWTGSDTVDVYRDNELQGTVNGTTFDDFIGAKGGATYTHKICQAGSTTVCSNITTTVF